MWTVIRVVESEAGQLYDAYGPFKDELLAEQWAALAEEEHTGQHRFVVCAMQTTARPSHYEELED